MLVLLLQLLRPTCGPVVAGGHEGRLLLLWGYYESRRLIVVHYTDTFTQCMSTFRDIFSVSRATEVGVDFVTDTDMLTLWLIALFRPRGTGTPGPERPSNSDHNRNPNDNSKYSLTVTRSSEPWQLSLTVTVIRTTDYKDV